MGEYRTLCVRRQCREISVGSCAFLCATAALGHCDAGGIAAWSALVLTGLPSCVAALRLPTRRSRPRGPVPSLGVPRSRRTASRRRISAASGRRTSGSVASGRSDGAGNANREPLRCQRLRIGRRGGCDQGMSRELQKGIDRGRRGECLGLTNAVFPQLAASSAQP